MNSRKRKSPDFLITHQFDNDIRDLETNEILTIDDYKHIYVEDKPVVTSHIYKTNQVNATYVSGEKQFTKPLSSRDKIAIGDSEDGLPFKIIARDISNGNANLMFRFIDDHVATLMRKYAKLLSCGINPEQTIQNLIQEIDLSHEQHANTCLFNMSICIVYEYKNKVHCAGYTQGVTGLAYRISEKTLRETADLYKKENETPLTQDNYKFYPLAHSSTVNDTKKRIFYGEIERNNKIYGYSYLMEGLREYPDRESNEYKITDRIGFCLNDNTLKEKTLDLFKSDCINAEITGETCEIGDSVSTSYIIIPSEEIQALKRNQIQPRLALEKHKEQLLINLNKYSVNSNLYKAGKKVYDSVEKCEENPDCNAAELVNDLIACNKALTNNNPDNIKALHYRASLAKGRPCKEDQDLGSCLEIFGAILATIGTFLLPTPAGIGLIIAGGLMGMAGLSIFCEARQHGRSKELTDLADECKRSVRMSI